MPDAIKFLPEYQTMSTTTLILVAAAAAVAVVLASRREPFAAKKDPREVRAPGAKTFSWIPGPKGTYRFADPPSAARALDPALDEALRGAVDAFVPRSVLDGAGAPQPAPYVDTQAEDVAREALGRVRKCALDLMSVEYVAAAVDRNENLRYDIALIAYDRVKNVATKLSLTALVEPGGRTYVKRFEAFNREPSDKGPEWSDGTMRPVLTEFAPELGIDYEKMYPV